MLKCTSLCINHFKSLTPLLSNTVDIMCQQTRNTYILKRRYEVPLHKKNQRPPPLKTKYFIYELIENTIARKIPEIDLILTKNVPKLGQAGDRLKVKAEKAYESLLLPQLAVYATPENIEKYNAYSVQRTCPYSSLTAEKTLTQLSTLYLIVVMSMDTPWTLEKWHLRTNFRIAGINVPEHAITMPTQPIKGPDVSIDGRQFYVTVTINNVDQVKVRCILQHWTSDELRKIERDLLSWQIPCKAIFPEDQPILDSLPKHVLAVKAEKRAKMCSHPQ